MSTSIISPFPLFTDRSGNPLEAGYIYIGEENKNAEVNPIPVFWDSESTIPAPQPIRTIGGYPSRSGTPSVLFTSASDYSIIIKDKNSNLVFSAQSQVFLDGQLREDLQSSGGAGIIGTTSGMTVQEIIDRG